MHTAEKSWLFRGLDPSCIRLVEVSSQNLVAKRRESMLPFAGLANRLGLVSLLINDGEMKRCWCWLLFYTSSSSSCFLFLRLLSLFFLLLPVVGIFSQLFFLPAFPRYLFTQSAHLSCGLPRFLQSSCFFVSDICGNLPSFTLTMCPANFIRHLTITPTIQALVPTSLLGL